MIYFNLLAAHVFMIKIWRIIDINNIKYFKKLNTQNADNNWSKNINFKLINEFVQIFFAILSVAIYILVTYYNKDYYMLYINYTENENSYKILNILHVIELVLVIFSTVDIIIRFIRDKKKLFFFLNMHNLVDIIVIVPFYLNLICFVRN